MIESVAMFSAVVLSFARIFYSGVTNRLGNLTKWREGGRGSICPVLKTNHQGHSGAIRLVQCFMLPNKTNHLPKFRAYFPVMNAALEGESIADT